VGQNILRRRANIPLDGANYTKYNKIKNNSENFRGIRFLLGGLCTL